MTLLVSAESFVRVVVTLFYDMTIAKSYDNLVYRNVDDVVRILKNLLLSGRYRAVGVTRNLLRLLKKSKAIDWKVCSFPYANTPMQYTAIFHGCKNVHFQMIFLYFSYFCSKY